MGTRTFSTACPRNCYSTCTLNVQVAGGRIRRCPGPDGRRLLFSVGDLALGQVVTITYVAEVAAGAPTGPSTSVATARADPDLVPDEEIFSPRFRQLFAATERRST